MRLKCFIVIFILLAFKWISYAQEEIRFNHLNAENGGTNNSVGCIFQDSSGYIWFGSSEGLFRYDGNNMVIYVHKENDSTSISNSRINCIYEDNMHTIWIGTSFGLSKFNPVKKNFTNFYFDKWSPSMESSLVTHIIQDNKGILWVATNSGIYKADPANPKFSPVKSFTEDHYGYLIHGLESSAGGRIFMMMDTSLLYTDDYGKTFKSVVNYNLSGKSFFSSLYCDRTDGHLWFGTYRHCVAYEFDPKTFHIKKYSLDTLERKYSNYMANDFCRLNDSIMLAGCLFGGSNDGGLIFLNTKRNTYKTCFHVKENPSSLSTQNVTCIMKDYQNTFWIGTNLGINSFNLRQLNFHWLLSENCKVPGLNGFGIGPMCYNGNLWIGTGGEGLVAYNPSDHGYSWYPVPAPNPDKKHRNQIFSIYPYKDTLWLGVGGFIRFDINKHKFDTLTVPLPELKELYSNTARGIGRDNDGTYWFGTYNTGVFSYNPITGKGAHYLGREDTNLTIKYRNYIKCMSVDFAGNKWVGTYNDGFYRIDAVTNQITQNMPGDKKALIMQRGVITDIYCSKNGNVYIATQGDGLLIYEANTKKFRTVRNDKWPEDNKIKKIVQAENGDLWLATGKGLSYWSLNNNTFRNYAEGMPLASIITVSGCASPDGTIYFGGDDEILYFNPDKLIETTPYIHPEVTSISVMNKEYLSDISQPLFLSYRDNLLSFTFSAFDFLNEKADQFAYCLEGFDKDWNYCGNRHFAEYTNLPGGDYMLKLKVQNGDGVWVETAHPIILHITTPYWKTWWFFMFCGLAAFAMGYIFYYLKMQRELEAERLRARLARDLHDDIGSSLSSISILSEMAVKNSTSVDTQFIFSKIWDSSRKTMESMKDIVWTVNPENDSMESLITRMRIYASEMLEPKGIDYDFKTGVEIENCRLAMEQRRNFYLIFKEAINNIAKYSRCSNASIKIYKSGEKVEMKISDNGIGFNIANTSKGNGLKNMDERAKIMNGNLVVESVQSKGTIVKLVFPLT